MRYTEATPKFCIHSCCNYVSLKTRRPTIMPLLSPPVYIHHVKHEVAALWVGTEAKHKVIYDGT